VVDCAATLDFVSEDFLTWKGLQMRKLTKMHVRFANGLRVASTKLSDMTFTLAHHEFVRTFHVICDLRAADTVLGLQWLDDEKATLKFGTERLFTFVDGAIVEIKVVVRLPKCLLMVSTKVQKLMRK
jgi:hypothetical protein